MLLLRRNFLQYETDYFLHYETVKKYSSDGLVVRATASGAANLGLIPSGVKPITLKLVFTASLLDAQHQRNSVKNKSAGLRVVPLGKTLRGIFRLGVVDRWLATFKRTRIALRSLSRD